MTIRCAIYDRCTNYDIGELDDLIGACSDTDRFRQHRGMVLGIRLADSTVALGELRQRSGRIK